MNDPISALSDSDRRIVLSCLDEHHGPVDLERLAVEVVAACTETAPDAVDDDERDAAMVRLHHVDLPKLEDAGFVDFDHENGTVRRRRDATASASPTFSV